jgi:uncharacterized protein HemY
MSSSKAAKLKELGGVKYNNGDFKSAIELYTQAAELEPGVPVCYFAATLERGIYLSDAFSGL